MFHDHPRIRVGIYIVAIIAQIVAFFVNVYDRELGDAFQGSANFLAVVAGGTALTNIAPERRDDRRIEH
jgi:hypothetical protein